MRDKYAGIVLEQVTSLGRPVYRRVRYLSLAGVKVGLGVNYQTGVVFFTFNCFHISLDFLEADISILTCCVLSHWSCIIFISFFGLGGPRISPVT